ncbi:MAG TPA: hypothetical protein VNV86_17655 [Candidatus Acidoferrum sp.]|jgi:hypothetical protein|nr:hypothetical protein [Candidatus Acidoferrum sp.]
MEEKTKSGGSCFFCSTAIPIAEKIWDDATRNHFRNSRVEFLKGLRSIIDHRIDHLSREEHKGTHVTVE